MSDVKRDPRMNPQPGDVLCKGGKERRVVRILTATPITEMDVRYVRDGRIGACFISYWRRWAQDAEVIHVAD